MPGTIIKLRGFQGMVPRKGKQRLDDPAAGLAKNCLLLSGELRPLHHPQELWARFAPRSHAFEVDGEGSA